MNDEFDALVPNGTWESLFHIHFYIILLAASGFFIVNGLLMVLLIGTKLD